MPTLTGTLADVTGTELAPAQIARVYVKAPGNRPSLADGDLLIVSAPVTLDLSGTLAVDLEPGPAVLVVDTHHGGPDTYELYVTADMTLLAEAVDEAAPAHERSWAESVMVRLRDEAVAAADRAEQAATGVDEAIGDAADQVIAAVEQDRQRAESAAEQTGLDRVATGEDREQTGLDREQTGADRVATGEDREATGQDRTAVANDRAQTGLDRQAANQSATDAAGSASAADSSRVDAEAAEAQARAHAESFGVTAEGVTGEPGSETSVSVSGDGPAYHLEVTVAQGEKGDTGDQGPQGERGPEGPEGPQGEKGDTGDPGVWVGEADDLPATGTAGVLYATLEEGQ